LTALILLLVLAVFKLFALLVAVELVVVFPKNLSQPAALPAALLAGDIFLPGGLVLGAAGLVFSLG
jgi:hypothetical protein